MTVSLFRMIISNLIFIKPAAKSVSWTATPKLQIYLCQQTYSRTLYRVTSNVKILLILHENSTTASHFFTFHYVKYLNCLLKGRWQIVLRMASLLSLIFSIFLFTATDDFRVRINLKHTFQFVSEMQTIILIMNFTCFWQWKVSVDF